MQTAHNVLASINPQLKQGVQPSRADTGSRQGQRTTANGQRVTAQDVDNVFDAMRSMFGNRFSSQWGQFDEGGVWLAELAHLPTRMIEIGLGRLRVQIRDAARAGDTAWPPQPLEFAAMCEPTPADLGMPSAAEAWAEANAAAHNPAGHRWSHPAVQMAGQAIGWFEIHQTTARTTRERLEKRFEREYQALVNRVMAGEPLEARGLLETDSRRSVADLAERDGQERAKRQAEAAGYGHIRSAGDAFAAMRAGLRG